VSQFGDPIFKTLIRKIGQPQTLGTSLNNLLPTLFPSRKSPLLALPILHGSVVPLSTHIETLGEGASYADGFLHIVVVMIVN
jgi:autophagy-related protein 5